jgi:RNA polymerase sigma-32 factor
LSAEEEYALAQDLQETGNIESAQKLVLPHLRFVIKVANNYAGYGLPIADLIQEGSIGLMKAVKRFRPEVGVRLVSFAVHWIKAEIYDYILKNWRIVKVATTKAQRKLFFNLRKSREHLGWMNDSEIGKLSDNLDVPEETVREMESRMTGTDLSFTISQDDDDNGRVAPEMYFSDSRYDPEKILADKSETEQQHHQLHNALSTLDARSRDIISRRWLAEDSKATLHELADEYEISAERIRQIEKKAMDQMKQAIAL